MKILMLLLILISFEHQAKAEVECDYKKIKDSPYHVKTSDLLTRALQSNCSDLMEMALKSEEPDELYRSTLDFMRSSFMHMSTMFEMAKGIEDDDPFADALKSKLKILGKFGSFLSEKCPDSTKSSDECKAMKNYKEYALKITEKLKEAQVAEAEGVKQEAYANSSEGLIERICACDKFIDFNQKIIEREKEIGKVSGTINKVNLNNAGIQIVDLKRIKNEALNKYKKLTKKSLSKYKCENVEGLTNPLLRGTGINSL